MGVSFDLVSFDGLAEGVLNPLEGCGALRPLTCGFSHRLAHVIVTARRVLFLMSVLIVSHLLCFFNSPPKNTYLWGLVLL